MGRALSWKAPVLDPLSGLERYQPTFLMETTGIACLLAASFIFTPLSRLTKENASKSSSGSVWETHGFCFDNAIGFRLVSQQPTVREERHGGENLDRF